MYVHPNGMRYGIFKISKIRQKMELPKSRVYPFFVEISTRSGPKFFVTSKFELGSFQKYMVCRVSDASLLRCRRLAKTRNLITWRPSNKKLKKRFFTKCFTLRYKLFYSIPSGRTKVVLFGGCRHRPYGASFCRSRWEERVPVLPVPGNEPWKNLAHHRACLATDSRNPIISAISLPISGGPPTPRSTACFWQQVFGM